MPKQEKPPLFPRLAMFLWSVGPVVLVLGIAFQPEGSNESGLTLPIILGALTTAAGAWYLWRLWPIRLSEWTAAWEAGRWGNKKR